jgi:hypothetical protein
LFRYQSETHDREHTFLVEVRAVPEPPHVLKPESSLRGALNSAELFASSAAAVSFQMSRRIDDQKIRVSPEQAHEKSLLVLSCKVIVGHLLYRNEKLPAGELWLSIAE